MVTQVKSSNIAVGAITSDQIASGAITVADIPDGEITAAKLHTTLDLSSKTITYPSNSVTANALHTTAITDKLGYTPVAPGDSPSFAGLTVDTNTLYVDATNNRVGIGISSPAAKLDVSGTGTQEVRITSDTSGNSRVGFNVVGSSYTYIEVDRASGATVFAPGGTEQMRIDSSGKVLVGTTTARGTITVNGSVSPIAAPSSVWGIDFGTSTSNGNYVTIANNATYALSGGAGCVWIYEQTSSVGLCMVNFAYGGSYIVSNPQNNYSTTVNTASKTNIYYDPGTGQYTIQNKMGVTYSYWIATMRVRVYS